MCIQDYVRAAAPTSGRMRATSNVRALPPWPRPTSSSAPPARATATTPAASSSCAGTERSTPCAATRTTRSRAGGCAASARSATTARSSTRRPGSPTPLVRDGAEGHRRLPGGELGRGARARRRAADGRRRRASVRRRSSTRTTPARSRSSATASGCASSTASARPRSTPTRSATSPATSRWTTSTARRRSGSTRARAADAACILVWGANPSASAPHTDEHWLRRGAGHDRRDRPDPRPGRRSAPTCTCSRSPAPTRRSPSRCCTSSSATAWSTGRSSPTTRSASTSSSRRSPRARPSGASARPASRRPTSSGGAPLRSGPVAPVARAGHAAPADRRQRDALLRAAPGRHRQPRPARHRVPLPQRRDPARHRRRLRHRRAPRRAGAAGRQPDGPRRAPRGSARARARCWPGTSTSPRPTRSRRACARRSRARTCSPSRSTSSRPTRPISPTSCCRPRAFLECDDLVLSYFDLSVSAQAKAGEPPGDALPNPEIFRRLAAAMGYTEPELFEPDERGHRGARAPDRHRPGLRRACAQVGTVPYGGEPIVQFPGGVVPTPSGRVEIASARAEADGLPRAPVPARRPRPGRRHAAAAEPGVALAAERLVRERPEGHPADRLGEGRAAPARRRRPRARRRRPGRALQRDRPAGARAASCPSGSRAASRCHPRAAGPSARRPTPT